jgi:ATP-dependent DNA ligase
MDCKMASPASISESAVRIFLSRGSLFTKQFPQIAQARERLPPNTLVDGESWLWMKAGGFHLTSSNITA